MPVRDGRGTAARGPAAAAAPAAAGPDRVRQDDRGRRAGHAVRRMRTCARAATDRAAGRGLRGRGGGCGGAARAPRVPAHVRPAVVAGPRVRRGRPAAPHGRPFSLASRRPRRAPLVHQDRRVRRLMCRVRASSRQNETGRRLERRSPGLFETVAHGFDFRKRPQKVKLSKVKKKKINNLITPYDYN